MPHILVSVIIPTYHDWAGLSKCLDALKKQTLDAAKFEIVIVNNDPENHPLSTFTLPSNATLIQEKKRGSYAARNTGIRQAKGDVLAFTDSDCIPSEKWLENALNHLKDDQILKRLSGKIELFFKNHPDLTAAELYEKEFAFRQHEYAKDGTAATANLFCRSEIFNDVGLFDENLISGGDFEWNLRAERMDYELRYADDVVVCHPARNSLPQIWKKSVRVYKGTCKVKKYNEESLFFKLFYGLYLLRPKISVIKSLKEKYKPLSLVKILGVKFIHDFAQMITHYKLVISRKL